VINSVILICWAGLIYKGAFLKPTQVGEHQSVHKVRRSDGLKEDKTKSLFLQENFDEILVFRTKMTHKKIIMKSARKYS